MENEEVKSENIEATTVAPKIEKINLSELNIEKEKIEKEETMHSFQNTVNLLFADLVRKLEKYPPELLNQYLDEKNKELDEKIEKRKQEKLNQN